MKKISVLLIAIGLIFSDIVNSEEISKPAEFTRFSFKRTAKITNGGFMLFSDLLYKTPIAKTNEKDAMAFLINARALGFNLKNDSLSFGYKGYG